MMRMWGGFVNTCFGGGSVKVASPIVDDEARVTVGGGLVDEDDSKSGVLVDVFDSGGDTKMDVRL
jgi:hypothetical protein